MARTSQKVAGVILIPYFMFGVALCVLVMDRKHCDSPYYYIPSEDDAGDAPKTLRRFENRFCAGGYHGILSLIGTLLIGFSRRHKIFIILMLLIPTFLFYSHYNLSPLSWHSHQSG